MKEHINSLNKGMVKNILVMVVIMLLLFGLDMITKYMFFDLKIMESWFLITPVFNKGIAWSVQVNHLLIFFITISAMIFVSYLYKKGIISKYVLVLLIVGSLGNMYDRVFLGGVRDFIDFHFFPVFNVADIYLSFAIIILIFEELIKK